MGNPHMYTVEYRRETSDYIISTARPVAQVAKELGINKTTAAKWVAARKRELAGEAPTSLTSPEVKEMQAMRKRIRDLEMENEFLKKASAYFAKLQG